MNNPSTLTNNTDYQHWLADLKQGFRQRQIKAAVAVNRELLEFYWQLGESIVERQQHSQWGDGFLVQLSTDLMSEFPDVKGFSYRNLKYMRQWYGFYADTSVIGQQAVAQLIQFHWGHNLVIISKCQNSVEALFYVKQTLQHGWSRSVLTHHIESRLYQREGKVISNFDQTLPLLPQLSTRQSHLTKHVQKHCWYGQYKRARNAGYKNTRPTKVTAKSL